MNELYLNRIKDSISESFNRNGMSINVDFIRQEDVKSELNSPMSQYNFSMIALESTDDNPMCVDIDNSIFLNGEDYKGEWIKGSYGESLFYMLCSNENETVVIDAIEVSKERRGCGIGRAAVEGVENFAIRYGFEKVEIKPFDSDSESFWNHMGYRPTNNYSLIKDI